MDHLHNGHVSLLDLQSCFLVPEKLETALHAYQILPRRTAQEKFAYLAHCSSATQKSTTAAMALNPTNKISSVAKGIQPEALPKF